MFYEVVSDASKDYLLADEVVVWMELQGVPQTGRLGGSVDWVSDFDSGHDLAAQVMILQFMGLSPVSGSVLTAQSLGPASDSVFTSRSPSPDSPSVSLSLSQK